MTESPVHPSTEDNTADEALGRNVRRLRRQRDWTLLDLALMVTHATGRSMTVSTIGRIERATRPTTLPEIRALAGVLGVPTHELVAAEEPGRLLEVVEDAGDREPEPAAGPEGELVDGMELLDRIAAADAAVQVAAAQTAPVRATVPRLLGDSSAWSRPTDRHVDARLIGHYQVVLDADLGQVLNAELDHLCVVFTNYNNETTASVEIPAELVEWLGKKLIDIAVADQACRDELAQAGPA